MRLQAAPTRETAAQPRLHRCASNRVFRRDRPLPRPLRASNTATCRPRMNGSVSVGTEGPASVDPTGVRTESHAVADPVTSTRLPAGSARITPPDLGYRAVPDASSWVGDQHVALAPVGLTSRLSRSDAKCPTAALPPCKAGECWFAVVPRPARGSHRAGRSMAMDGLRCHRAARALDR
jgi:hypothetical protein